MNVYVESNFVLEHALQQEESQSCTEILRIASRGQIRLVIPAFSLAESPQAILAKAKVRSRLYEDLRIHLNELARSKPHREIPATFDVLSSVLINSAQVEREGLKRTVSELLAAAEVIPLTAAVLRSAANIEVDFGLSGQDAIVLASVLGHLQANSPVESCFLNRNTKDFDDPDIRDRLEALHCKFFPRFAQAFEYIESRIQNADT
jgi:predicted nucleic acid-binding protein